MWKILIADCITIYVTISRICDSPLYYHCYSHLNTRSLASVYHYYNYINTVKINMAQKENVVLKLVEKVIENEKLENHKINIKPISTDGANYTSCLYLITVKSSDRQNLHLFAKAAILSESIRSEMKESAIIFSIERYFYTDIVPKLEELQEKYKIPVHEKFKTAKYYGSNTTHVDETMILEDLAIQGHSLYDRFLPLDWEYASKAVEELAKFHALSFASKYNYPEKYENSMFDSKMVGLFLTFKPAMIKTVNRVYSIIPDHLKERYRKYTDRQLQDDMFHKYYGSGKWKVLVHGDYRASNIMYKRENGKVTSLIPVDYQTLRFGSPSSDLIFLLYTGTDEPFRRAHVPQLLDLYYDTLSSWLRRMELDPDQLFSRRDFDQDYQDMLPYGLNISIFFLSMVLVDPKLAPTMGDENSMIENFSVIVTDLYKERFLPTLDEFVKLGII